MAFVFGPNHPETIKNNLKSNVEEFYFVLSLYQDYVKPFRQGGYLLAWRLFRVVTRVENFMYTNFHIASRTFDRDEIPKLLSDFRYWMKHCRKYIDVFQNRRRRGGQLAMNINMPEDINKIVSSYL